ncbi:MAG TPA: ABC transporter permease [Micropepsaceae bacterium]|nr:ABC transporter permease [Micropepsaceae bacterium]
MIENALILALRELRRNIMRAGLTTLGIIIGVAAVIAMVTLGNGATASVTNSISSLGRNLAILSPGTRKMSGAQSDASAFDPSDVEAIKRDIGNLRAVAPVVMRSEVAVEADQNHPTQIAGTDNAYFDAREWPLKSGRLFTDAEISSGKAVCVIGQTIRTTLFGSEDPLGAQIRVRDVPCDVIGTLSVKGQSTFGQDQDDIIVMPIRTVQRRLAGNTNVGTIWIATERAGDMPKVKADLTKLMRERRHLARNTPDDFQTNDMAQIAQIVQTTTGVLTVFLAAVAAVSLVVGGIGIMNIMLVSVTERTREIGIRLAIGARERDVLTQFLVEAVMMSAFGGVIGILLGLGASALGTHFLHFDFVPSAGVILLAFLFSGGIGVAFGYFPARRAARLDPIDALRHE